MAFVTGDMLHPIDQLQQIFARAHVVEVPAGELERLRAIEREARNIAQTLRTGPGLKPDLDRVFVQGSVLRGLVDLIQPD